jgi:RNA polymerase sigma-70 factor (ECF subfamily)
LVRDGDSAPPADHETLDDCFRAYAPYVAAIALKLLGRDAEVDDVVQEVFLAAWRGMSALRDPESRRGWLATVTVRRAARRLQMRRVRRFFGLDAETDYEVLCVGANQEDAALIGQVYRILDGIPVELRVPWVLQKVDGEPLERVALYCECSLATAKRRIAAAQARIEKETGR